MKGARINKVLEGLYHLTFVVMAIVGGILFFHYGKGRQQVEIDVNTQTHIISSTKRWVCCDIEIENVGETPINIVRFEGRVQQIKPIPPSIQKRLNAGQPLLGPNERKVNWPLLAASETIEKLILGPGEPEIIRCSFEIPREVLLVDIYVLVDNDFDGGQVWSIRKVHVID